MLCAIRVFAADLQNESSQINLDEIDQNRIDTLVNDTIKKSKTPGVSIVLVNGDKTKYLSYGYANKEQDISTNSDTLFEIGSMSKAFTGLGILLLEDEGIISLDDPITKYIPWLRLYYKGEHNGKSVDGEVELTIGNFLCQTSGIPFKTIGNIPQGISNISSEETVKSLIGTKLDFYPGEKYQYATINYDVLGYVIQLVSGQTYEDFMKNRIIEPLGLNNTYLFQSEAQATGALAQGYKMNFFQSKPYNAPRYRGNTPAGYIISNVEDMERWIRIQIGLIEIPEQYKRIIEKSHLGDTTVASQANHYYAAGWSVNIKGEDIQHGGSNPNYSSMLIMYPEDKLGICVLTNINSSAASYIAENILNIIHDRGITKYTDDTYKTMDTTFSLVFIGSAILGVAFFVFFVIAIIEIILKTRKREKLKGVKVAGILISIPIMMFYGYCIYYLPNVLLSRLPWQTVNVWGSKSIMYGSISAFFAGIIFFMYVIFTFNFSKPKEKNYFALIPLSLINGFAGALTIFTINETFNRNLEYSKELLIYFIFSIMFIAYSNRLFQSKMIVITNEISYEKRINMIDKIINSSFQAIEKIGGPRLYSGLNNDIGVYAQFPGMIIGFVSNVITLLFCLGYLYTISIAAFIVSICVLSLNCFIGYLVGQISRKYWEKNRDIQDVYFGQMNDLVYGFKELILSRLRKIAFWNDIKKYSKLSMDLSKEVAVKSLNFGLYNHIMYNTIFGVVVFLLPILVIGIDTNNLRQALFMVFYLLGPFGIVVGIIPTITNVRVNLKRIKKLISDLEEVSTGYSELESSISEIPESINLKLDNLTFSYIIKNEEKNEKDVEFTLGPINAEIKTGEITFVTGGNGSGKSTLGKVITGLYTPQDGKILLNGNVCNMVELNQCFTAVYSDFYLFKKLYGVDITTKKHEIQSLLQLMKLDNKVEIDENGGFKSFNRTKEKASIYCVLLRR